jgi:hypothetical protein
VISHSTSWRYSKDNSVFLAYMVYSDLFEFGDDDTSIGLAQLARPGAQRRPKEEAAVVVHGLRHMAFLFRTEKSFTADKQLLPETRRALAKIAGDTAGRI